MSDGELWPPNKYLISLRNYGHYFRYDSEHMVMFFFKCLYLLERHTGKLPTETVQCLWFVSSSLCVCVCACTHVCACVLGMMKWVGIVYIRNIQTCREFLWVYSSKADNCGWKAKSEWIEKIFQMLQRIAVLQFILYITMKRRHNEGYTIFIGGRLGRREKAKQGNLWDWIKSKVKRQILLLHWWVQES